MNLNAFLKFIVLHIFNQSENDLNTNAPAEILHSPKTEIVNLPPIIERTNNALDNRNLNEGFRQGDDLTDGLFPAYDCSMPKPPTMVNEQQSIEQHNILDYGIDASTQRINLEEGNIEIAINEDTNPQEATPEKVSNDVFQSQSIEPESKQDLIKDVEKPKSMEEKIITKPRVQASMEIPPHIVPKLPDPQMLDLMRFESYCIDKINDVYRAIRVFNNFNYEKNQEIQYLSCKDKEREEIIMESNEKKHNIKLAYVRMHFVCGRSESKRDEITTMLNPLAEQSKEFYAQPARVPICWYDIHNLENIILQLFTPKLSTKTYFDENERILRMRPRAKLVLTRKQFIALPNDYISQPSKPNEDSAVDGSSLIVNQLKKAIEISNIKHDGQLKNDIFEQYTYSTRVDNQEIIIYYQFKYWEYKVQDLIRNVFYSSKMLKEKKRIRTDEKKISELEEKLAETIAELQRATLEMERNRVIPEIVNLYNAEIEVYDLLPNTKFISKLIGGTYNKKREPLEWDRNWSWDF